MITNQGSPRKWKPIDALLIQAVSLLDAERCPSCGNYRWLCGSSDSRIDIKIEPYRCDGKAAIEMHEKNDKEKEPGVSYRPVYKDSRGEIPTHKFRERYYAQRRADAEDTN